MDGAPDLSMVQVELVRETALIGPHAFSLERMLAVFWQLLKGEDDPDMSSAELSAGVHMQIATLTALKLLTRVSKRKRIGLP